MWLYKHKYQDNNPCFFCLELQAKKQVELVFFMRMDSKFQKNGKGSKIKPFNFFFFQLKTKLQSFHVLILIKSFMLYCGE